jgi:hypothetical protein
VTIALDIGASQFRTLRRDGDRLLARSVDACYSVLTDTPAHRRLLAKASVPFSQCDGNIILLGQPAADSASLFRVPCRRLLPHGRVPTADPLARQLLAGLIETVLPTAETSREICCLALPSGMALEAAHADVDFYSQIVRLEGYQPRILPASQSLILAELVASSFTGVGLVFGASGCEALLAHRGQPLCHAQTSFGGHTIDEHLRERDIISSQRTANDADPTVDLLDGVTAQRIRETVTPSERAPAAGIEHAVAEELRRAAEKLIAAFDAELRRTPRVSSVPGPVAVICAGGLAQTPGFARLIGDVIGQCELPIVCQAPGVANASARSVLRGLLISGELDASPTGLQKAA